MDLQAKELLQKKKISEKFPNQTPIDIAMDGNMEEDQEGFCECGVPLQDCVKERYHLRIPERKCLSDDSWILHILLLAALILSFWFNN